MPNEEVTSETVKTETKQLIGSSKRKRKSSVIKHNVVQDDKLQSNESDSTSRTYMKKVRNERGKNKLQSDVTTVTDNIKQEVNSKDCKSLDTADAALDSVESVENKEGQNAKTEDVMAEECTHSSTKSKSKSNTDNKNNCTGRQEKCQNCNFCAQPKTGSPETDVKVEYASKMYTCKVCAEFGLKRVYNSLEKFKRHTKEVHEPKKEVKRFECTDCPEPVWFSSKSKFCYHLGAKHPGVIKFICEVCTLTFKLKANYKNHLKTHNIVVQKKFSCDVCSGTFVNRAGYEAHKKRFPGPHIKQSCVHCGVSFSKEKHMKNHRCKILLLREAEAARESQCKQGETDKGADEGTEEDSLLRDGKLKFDETHPGLSEKRLAKEGTSESEADASSVKKQTTMTTTTSEGADATSGKRVVLHRVVPKKSNEKLVYKQYPVQGQSVPQSVVVQEIDLDGGAFITAEPDHQIILRDVNGHLVQGNQILQLDINDFQGSEESQVYLADWNVVAPFVIRGKSP